MGESGVEGEQEALLNQVFRELQDIGLISLTHHLQPIKRGFKDRPSFRADLVRRKRIHYWLDNFRFDADGLRFFLLHEERHMAGYAGYLSLASWIISWIAWGFFFLYLAWKGYFQQPPWISLYFLIFPAGYYSALPFLMIDEFRSDEWAALQLKTGFGISRPSEVLARNFPPQRQSHSNRIVARLFDVLHLEDYHPSEKRRIERIARMVDDCGN
jgi:hypothetical protein